MKNVKILFFLLICSNIVWSNDKEIDPSDSYYKQQRQAFNDGDWRKYLEYSTKLAIALQKNKSYKSSIGVLNEAINEAASKVEPDSVLALAYHKLAVAEYNANNDDDMAIQFWKKALSIREEIHPKNHKDIIKAYKNIGNSYDNLERYEDAEHFLKRSLDLHLSKDKKDEELLAMTYNSITHIYTKLRDFDNAKKCLEIALNSYEEIYKDEPYYLPEVYESAFNLYQELNDTNQMIVYPKKTLAAYESIAADEMYNKDYFIATAHSHLGVAYLSANSLEIAKKHFLKSLKINQRFEEERQAYVSENYSNLSLVYKSLGDYSTALKYNQKALDINNELDDNTNLAYDLNNRAEIYLHKGDGLKALKYIRECLNSIKLKGINSYNRGTYASFLTDKVRILAALNEENLSYQEETQNTLDTIVALFNQIRSDFISDESKNFLSQKAKAIFEKGLVLNLDLYEENQDEAYLKKAFEFVQQSKSLTLLEAINDAKVKRKYISFDPIFLRENKIKKQIVNIEKDIYEGGKSTAILQNNLIALNRALEKIQDTLKVDYPKYFNAKYQSSKFTYEDIQLKMDETLIEYLVGDSMIYVFALQNDEINVIKIKKDFPLTDLTNQLRKSIYQEKLSVSRSDKDILEAANSYVKVAHDLYNYLFKPIEQKVDLGEKIIIATDGILGLIPFEALLSTEPNESVLFGSHDYLINKYEIDYTYSAAYLAESATKENSNTSKEILAFAPTFSQTDQLSSLHNNILEVKGIHSSRQMNLFEGKDASKSNFIENASNYKILHLATHGKANNQIGAYAYLAFTPEPENDQSHKLYNLDLYNLSLNADMVVLSACESGIGELKKGEGIISLARGFSYAGAKSVITSLWRIDDKKTKEIISDFYNYLKKGQAKGTALRNAKLDFINKNSHNAHPFYWAAFIPLGDMQPIYSNNKNSLFFYLAGSGFLFSCIFFFLKVNK